MYTFELTKEGYYISKRGKRILYQYEPFIPFRKETMEESAVAHINALIADDESIEMRVEILEEMINELLLGGL